MQMHHRLVPDERGVEQVDPVESAVVDQVAADPLRQIRHRVQGLGVAVEHVHRVAFGDDEQMVIGLIVIGQEAQRQAGFHDRAAWRLAADDDAEHAVIALFGLFDVCHHDPFRA